MPDLHELYADEIERDHIRKFNREALRKGHVQLIEQTFCGTCSSSPCRCGSEPYDCGTGV